MTLPKPKAGSRKPGARKPGVDLVPDETSEAFSFIERSAREGRRVPTQGMSDEEVRALLLGNRKDG